MNGPTVFLSAVTGDFGMKFLDDLSRVVQNLGCICSYRGNLQQSGTILPEKLFTEIERANCVIHLVGPSFGHGPQEVMQPDLECTPAGEFWKAACQAWWPAPFLPTRRSYTQMEYDFARKLKRPVFVIFVDDPAINVAAADQPPEEAALQSDHRQAILASGHEYVRTDSAASVALVASKLPFIVDHLREMLRSLQCMRDAEQTEVRRASKTIFRVSTVVVVLLLAMAFWQLQTKQAVEHGNIENQISKRELHTLTQTLSSIKEAVDSQKRQAASEGSNAEPTTDSLKRLADMTSGVDSLLARLEANTDGLSGEQREALEAQALSTQGDIEMLARKYDEAAKYYSQASARFNKQTSFRDWWNNENNLSIAYERLDMWDKVMTSASKLLDEAQMRQGDDEEYSLKTCHRLATVEWRMAGTNPERLATAELHCKRVHEQRRELLGASHKSTLDSQEVLAQIAKDLGDVSSADGKSKLAEEQFARTETLLLDTLSGRQKNPEVNGVYLPTTMFLLAKFYSQTGNYQEAKRFGEMAKDAYRDLGDKKHTADVDKFLKDLPQ